MRLSKKRYLQGFIIVTIVLAIVRCAFPGIATVSHSSGIDAFTDDSLAYIRSGSVDKVTLSAQKDDTVNTDGDVACTDAKKDKDGVLISSVQPVEKRPLKFYNPDGSLRKNRIYSVPTFKNTFPDLNDVQMDAAKRNGVSPVKNRLEAEHRMTELVYIGANPYFYVDKLDSSIPYLVPRAAVLLQDIGRAFYDSLQIKGIPLHKIIVTSVMRTKEDVQKLRNHNGNATENSCHLYGTTVDICYNRYKTIEDPDGPSRRQVRNDTLKWVLSEVLRDFRDNGRCYIKYEVKQGCFHMTVN
ncbi:DUF5715 family protein [Xylanibacter muris]|uniref:Peptidase M15A C-terminal domain-containing protein n=1 Tax=Xylanibacter muris TaxID=2736290 RepID=A0ABX2AP35_9BACT|nr:DUF5715 family protein [Xylanibacter muris]NPD93008.1 hypothetical protein [Xylanibacter muris]